MQLLWESLERGVASTLLSSCSRKFRAWNHRDASHIVIPDVEALVALLEVWELPAAANFLLLSSVLRQVRWCLNGACACL
jgi:hypothetical protein